MHSNKDNDGTRNLCSAMATHYAYSGPIDCTQEPNVNNVKGKMVIVTGGTMLQYVSEVFHGWAEHD